MFSVGCSMRRDRRQHPPNRAAEHKDPHAIKLAEACLREYWLRPNPVYLLAAQTVIKRTSPM